MNTPVLSHIGFETGGIKQAVLAQRADKYLVKNNEGKVCFEGEFEAFGYDPNAGEELWRADFSELKETGAYTLCADNGCEVQFEIRQNAYEPVLKSTLKAFYYLRCGCALTPEYAGEFTHDVCHAGRALVWEDTSKSYEADGGWHDAGDYGRYITAGACALAHLLFAYRLYPQVFDSLEVHIPKSGGRLPDILAECRYELSWMLKMQREDGGVYHKVSTAHHAAFVMPEKDTSQLYLFPVSSMATADFAAVCALASRIYRPFDAEFADCLFAAAQRADKWLVDHPDFLGFRNPKGCDTGEYGERGDRDNRFWACAELFACTGEELYHERMMELLKSDFSLTALGYGSVGGFGALTYLLCDMPNRRRVQQEKFRDAFLFEAVRLNELMAASGYHAAMSEQDYCWGSNMNLMKHAMIFAIADTVCGVKAFGRGVEYQLQCLLGCNPMDFCYISGFGEKSLKNPHLRPAYADGVEECIPGMVSGGPNRHPADEDAKRLIPAGTSPMKCFTDHVGCYSLNEITIYWNSPVVFALAYLM